MRLRDESSWVRGVTLDLLGRVLESGLDESASALETPRRRDALPGDGGANAMMETALGSAASLAGAGEKVSAMLLRFHTTVRGRIHDTSLLVRRQASKILSAFLLNHPEHPEAMHVAHDLMKRANDSDALRDLVLGTFELLWFMDDEPSPRAALQLAQVVDAAGTMGMAPSSILAELLARFRANVGSRKRSKGYDFAVRRWTTLLLNEFVSPSTGRGDPRHRIGAKVSDYEVRNAPASATSSSDLREGARRTRCPPHHPLHRIV